MGSTKTKTWKLSDWSWALLTRSSTDGRRRLVRCFPFSVSHCLVDIVVSDL